MDKKKSSTELSNSNDDSRGQCYAPVEGGHVNKAKKQHIPEGKSSPPGWKEVECGISCQFRK